MRIFTNIHPGSVRNDLRAYRIDADDLRTIQIKITRREAESFLGGGIFALHKLHLQKYEEQVRDYRYIGSLAEEDKSLYSFRVYYGRKDARVDRLPLPGQDELIELGLV